MSTVVEKVARAEDEGVPSDRVSPQSELLKALAARCGREEPSSELNRAIWLAVTPGATFKTSHVKHTHSDAEWDIDEAREASGRLVGVPNYGESLDAAVSLVPDWLEWQVIGGGRESKGRFAATVRLEEDIWEHEGDGASAALALCAAALSMLADIEQWGFEVAGGLAEQSTSKAGT